MRKLIEEKQIGTRTICGTQHPIMSTLEREQLGRRRPTWIITDLVCNGTASGAIEYPSESAALEKWRER